MRTCLGCAFWAGLKTQAILAVQTSSFRLTFNSHNAIPLGWAWLQEHWRSSLRLSDLSLSIQAVLSRVARLLGPPESQPLSRPPALTRQSDLIYHCRPDSEIECPPPDLLV